MNILIIAAHPDDEVIGCGGTIAKLINEGQKIFILFMAEGVTARFEKNQIDSIKAKKEILIREKNAISANKVLGVKKQHIIFSKNTCCRMDTVPLIDHTKLIEKYIQKFKPNRIFTHSPLDLNVDHRLTFQAVMTATRPKKSNIFLNEIFLDSNELEFSSSWLHRQHVFYISLNELNYNFPFQIEKNQATMIFLCSLSFPVLKKW